MLFQCQDLVYTRPASVGVPVLPQSFKFSFSQEVGNFMLHPDLVGACCFLFIGESIWSWSNKKHLSDVDSACM